MTANLDRYIIFYLIILLFVLSGGIIQVAGAFFDVPKRVLQPLVLVGAGALYTVYLLLNLFPTFVSNLISRFQGFSVMIIHSIFAGKPLLKFLSRCFS